MSKLFISLLFLLIIIYSLVIWWMYIYQWEEKCKYEKECIDQEHQIGLQQIEIDKLKHQLANLKKSLYNESKEDKKHGIKRNH